MIVTDFLLARIAEDEAVARATNESSWEAYPLPDAGPNRWTMTGVGVAGDEMGHRTETMFADDASHIARHDPARVLAECEAKRRIVKFFDDERNWSVGSYSDGMAGAENAVLPALALPYADHPDYREEWGQR